MPAFISYSSTTKTYTIQPGASTADIQATINAAPDGSTIFFAAGTHTLTATLNVIRDNISLKGAGMGTTTLLVDHAATGGDGIFIRGSNSTTWSGVLSQSVTKGSTFIKLASVTGLAAGDILHVQQSNDDTFLNSGPYENIKTMELTATSPLRESLVQVDHIVGNIVYLKHAVAYDMQWGKATVSRYDLADNIKVSDFSMTYNLPPADDALFENTIESYDNKAALNIEKTFNLQLDRIEITNAASHAIEIRRALEAHVDTIKTDGAHNKGSDGNGYSLHIAESFYGDFTNLELMNGRHAVAFSSWNAEAYNNVHVALTNRDINYHGSPDHSNVVIIDKMVYSAGTDFEGDDRAWFAVGPGSDLHPASTIDANTTLFKHLEAAFRDDTAFGWDGGAYLDGKGGNDVLTGGAGADTIIGGTGNDVLMGRGGVDKFVYAHPSGGTDTILDFKGGVGGDKLVLWDMFQFASVADVKFTQVGTDAKFSTNGVDSVILKNFTASNFTTDNVELKFTAATLNLNMTTLADNIFGSTGNDVITVRKETWNTGERIDLNTGYDTLKVTGAGFSLNLFSPPVIKGIESLDFRNLTSDGMVVKLTDAFVGSAEYGKVTVWSGAQGISSIDTYGLTGTNEVRLKGSGVVTLASNGTQQISVESSLTINGGTSADFVKLKYSTVTANTGGGNDVVTVMNTNANIVNLGDGNDRAVYTVAPTSAMKVDGGAGTDVVQFDRAVTLSASVLDSLKGIEFLDFRGTSNTIALGNNMLAAPVSIESGGTAVVAVSADVSALTGSKTIILDNNVNLTLTGTTNAAVTVQMTKYANGQFVGSNNAEIIRGDSLGDKIDGGGGNDKIFGFGGVDTIKGGAGDDVIDGGRSSDLIWGGSGNDRFVSSDKLDGRDIIHDFNKLTGEKDVLDLTALIAAAGLGGRGFASLMSTGHLKLTQSGADVNVSFDADGAASTTESARGIFTILGETIGDLNATNVIV